MGDTLEAFTEYAAITGGEWVDMTHNLLHPLAEHRPDTRGTD